MHLSRSRRKQRTCFHDGKSVDETSVRSAKLTRASATAERERRRCLCAFAKDMNEQTFFFFSLIYVGRVGSAAPLFLFLPPFFSSSNKRCTLVKISSSHRSRLNVRLGSAETSPRSFSILSYALVHSRVHRLLYCPSFSDITDVQAATNAPRRALQRNICSENLRIDEKTFEGHPARHWHVCFAPLPSAARSSSGSHYTDICILSIFRVALFGNN